MKQTRMLTGSVVLGWLLLTGAAVSSGRAEPLPMPRPVDEPRSPAECPAPAPLGLDDLIRLSLEANPELRRAGLAIAAAQGRALQAGLYPNPTLSGNFDELGDRLGPGGINTFPYLSQEIVTAHKLKLSRALAGKEADQASLAFVAQRYTLFTIVRRGYFEVLAWQRRVEVLDELVRLAAESTETTEKLIAAKLAARLDLLQLRVELNRYRADRAAAQQELTAAWKRLAADMGVPNLPCAPLKGSLEAPLPGYEYCPALKAVLDYHPDLGSAKVGVARAQFALKRAQVEPIPNITVGSGYVRQNQNLSDDWVVQVAVPVPVFNRNQGNIAAAHAELGRALEDVRRVEYDLTARLATAFGNYLAAREQVDRYRANILPDSQELNRLAVGAFKGGQFDYLRVLEAQRAVAEANLLLVRYYADAWRAASDIAGLLLEEQWPLAIPGAVACPTTE